MSQGLIIGEPTPSGEWIWDGRNYPYVPHPDGLRIGGGLRLHQPEPVPVDPITFEVISAKLWNINEEHAETIRRVSGSPIVVHANDFNTCIATESGESFMFAAYIQYFAAAAEYFVKYTLENRSDSPGIGPEDIFIHNDPLVAGSHQQDVGVFGPLFVGDEIFCWLFSAAHQRDVGGTEPGSFCVDAKDIYADPTPITALKLVDERGIRRDTEDQVLRLSRIPNLFALELRAQIAGIHRTRERVRELISVYGADTVKSVMYKLIEDTERAVGERLASVPDGRWTDVNLSAGAFLGDRDVHRMTMTVEKIGDTLVFDNFGTDPQVGSINCGFAQWRAGIACSLTQMFAYEHRYCTAGVLRRARFRAELGTMCSIDRDGAVSTLHAQFLSVSMSGKLLSRIVQPDPELAKTAMSFSGISTAGHLPHYGTDQYGNPFATVTLDEVACGLGAFSFRDGIDQGGCTFWPISEANECEDWETSFPVLYLYRRSARNGGHGRYRGGSGLSLAFLGHRSDDQLWAAGNMAGGIPTSSGLFGGHHGNSCFFYSVQGTDIRERFSRGEMPADHDAIAATGDGRVLLAKEKDLPLGQHDVAEMAVYGAGGYGDPVRRDPHLVAQDVADQRYDAALAAAIYGVVVDDGGVDVDATEEQRAAIRASRLRHAQRPGQIGAILAADAPQAPVGDGIVAAIHDGRPVLACADCHATLAPVDENYKTSAAWLDTQLHEIDPTIFTDPALDTDEPVAYRLYLCPRCGIVLDSELTIAGEPPLFDTMLLPDSVTAFLAGRAAAASSTGAP